MTDRTCPSGMYPMDCDAPEEFDTFAELRSAAENGSDSLNFPISWTLYDESNDDWGRYVGEGEEDQAEFTLVFLMPRKWGSTWGVRTRTFDRAEVEAWLAEWLPGEVSRWYGFSVGAVA